MIKMEGTGGGGGGGDKLHLCVPFSENSDLCQISFAKLLIVLFY